MQSPLDMPHSPTSPLQRLGRRLAPALLLCCAAGSAFGQVDEDQLGAWYMYFFDTTFADGPWGLQGDAQYRNWDIVGDLEQLLLRGGLTYRPESADVLLTLGYANITTGAFGDSSATTGENRVYQELLLPQKVGARVFLRHRFRYEQRWVDDQDFRTRFRYALFVNVPLNGPDIVAGTWYLSLYNELFLNGERDVGDGRQVEIFDRNRFYVAMGYGLSDGLRVQAGYMHQYTDTIAKGQLQLSLHHSF